MYRFKLLLLLFIVIFSQSCQKEIENVNVNSEIIDLEKSIKSSLNVNLISQSEGEYLITGNDISLKIIKISDTEARIINSKMEEIYIVVDPNDISKMTIKYQDGRVREGVEHLVFFIKGIESSFNEIHLRAETFQECFVREWKDFCEDLVSCVAQATNPVGVAIAIAIHCS